MSNLVVMGSLQEENAYIYYISEKSEGCTQDPENAYYVNLVTGTALVVFSESGPMRACFRFGGSQYVERPKINVLVSYAYIQNSAVNSVVVGDTESKSIALSGDGISVSDVFKVVYSSCDEEGLVIANVETEQSSNVIRLKLNATEQDKVYLCYQFPNSIFYMLTDGKNSGTPYMINVKDIRSFLGAEGFGTSAIVVVDKLYRLSGFGLSNADKIDFQKENCRDSESALAVTDGQVTFKFNDAGYYRMCYQFSGERMVEFPYTVRVVQVSRVDPEYVVKQENSTVDVYGKAFVEEDTFGYLMKEGTGYCEPVVDVFLSSEQVRTSYVFPQSDMYYVCIRLEGDSEFYTINNVYETVVDDYVIDFVDNVMFPVTTIEERDTHDIVFNGKTVSATDKVKFVETMDCSEEAEEYSVVKKNLQTIVSAVFSKKVPMLYICYKFNQKEYRLLNQTISLMYVETVEPQYIVIATDSVLYLTGEQIENGYVMLSSENTCSDSLSERRLRKDAFGKYYVETIVRNYHPLVYMCFKYPKYGDKYYYTGLAVDMYGLDSISEESWLVNLPLPSENSVNTEGLILYGKGLSEAIIRLVKYNYACNTFGIPLTIHKMNDTSAGVTETPGSNSTNTSTSTNMEMEQYLVDQFTVLEAGNYKFCVRFEDEFLNYDYVTLLVEEYYVDIEGASSVVSLVKRDDPTSKNFTFTGAVKYFVNVDVKLIEGNDCSASNVEDVMVSDVNGSVVTVLANSGVESVLYFCVLLGSNYYHVNTPLEVKELTTLTVGDMVNTLKLTEGTYEVSVAGYHVGGEDMLRFVPVEESCDWVSVLTLPVGGDRKTSLEISSTLTHDAYKVCYKFSGEEEYAEYSSKTLNVYLISSIQPTQFVANVYQETEIVGLGREVGDKIWFTEWECGEPPVEAVEVTNVEESVMLMITNSMVHYMCYWFQSFGTVRVGIEVTVFDVTALSHSGWLTAIPLPTTGYASGTESGPMVLTGSLFSLSDSVKFVKSEDSCTGISTDPLQITNIEIVDMGQKATLSSILFPEAGDYYLCIVHGANSNEYRRYGNLKVTVETTAISESRNDAEMFVLTEDPIQDTFSLTEPFLKYVSGTVEPVWTESTCMNYVEVTVNQVKTESTLQITSTFTRTYSSLSLCLRLPGDVYVASRIRKVFKVFTTIESPSPFMSETHKTVPFTILGQNLKVDDRLALVPSSMECSGVGSVVLNSGSLSIELDTAYSDYKVCYQYSEFGETSSFYQVGDVVLTVYQLTSVSPSTLVQGQTQTVTLGLKNNKDLPVGYVVRIVAASESCTMATASVSAIVSNDNSMEMSPVEDIAFEKENMVCVSRDENSPFFSFDLDVSFAKILPTEDPLLLLRNYNNKVLFSNEASAMDKFKFVELSEDCSSSTRQDVPFTLEEETTSVFNLTQGFMDNKLCYNFYQSQGYFAYDQYMVNMLPLEGNVLLSNEIEHAFRVVTKNYQNLVTFFTEAMAVSYTDSASITDGASSLVKSDLEQSAKVLHVLRMLNIDFDSFARGVVSELTDNANVTRFVDAYAHEVMNAYAAGDSELPQALLVLMVKDYDGNSAKVDAIMEGWRSLAESTESSVDGEADFSFSDGSEIVLSPSVASSSSRRLEETDRVSVKINRYECVMIDTDITEGNCYEVLINGTVAGEFRENMELAYTKRMADDRFCAQKANIISIGWQLFDSGAANDKCRFESGKAIMVGKSFGVVTTFTQKETSVAEMDTGVLTALLIIAMVIFVILFIALAYALWVYVHPEDFSDINNLWTDFDEQRKNQYESNHRALMQRREQNYRLQQEYMGINRRLGGEQDEDFGDAQSDNSDAADYQSALAFQNTNDEEDYPPFQAALQGTSQSAQMAQLIAENTQIYQDDTMMRDEDIGEHDN